MNSANYRARRANTDDVAALVQLWQSAHLLVGELDKRFTEFQVVENADGKLLGAIGLQISGPEGKIHSEAYTDFALTDALRPLLWERIKTVATNHGLFRLWTDEPAPFWKKECGFVPPSAEILSKFPAQFERVGSTLLILQLKEDRAEPEALDAEFNRFKAEEKLRTDKMFEQARLLQGITRGFAVILFIVFIIGVIYLFRAKAHLQH
jgi:N-acetylglutamate synthase-like GNAT family acetyltransferase